MICRLKLCFILLASHCVESALFGYYYNSSSMKVPCPNCPAGYEPKIRCGKVKELSTTDIECVLCSEDSYKIDNTWNMCQKCSICSTNEVETIPCSVTGNRRCECKVGYYKDKKTGRCQPLQMDFYGSYYERKCIICPKKRCIDCPAGKEPVTPCGKVDDLRKVNMTCRACPDGTRKEDVSWQSCIKVIIYEEDVDNTYMGYSKYNMVAILAMMTATITIIILVVLFLCYWRHRGRNDVDKSMKKLEKLVWTNDTASPDVDTKTHPQHYCVLDMSERKKVYEAKMEITLCCKEIQENHKIQLNDPEKMGAFVTKCLQEKLKSKKLDEIYVNLTEIKNEEIPSSESISMEIESRLDVSTVTYLGSVASTKYFGDEPITPYFEYPSYFCEELRNRYSKGAMAFSKTLSDKVKKKAKFDNVLINTFEYQKWEFTDSNLLMTAMLKKKNKKHWSVPEKCKAVEYFHESFEEMFNGVRIKVRQLHSTVLLKDKYKFSFKFSFTNEDSRNAVNNFINDCTKEKNTLFL